MLKATAEVAGTPKIGAESERWQPGGASGFPTSVQVAPYTLWPRLVCALSAWPAQRPPSPEAMLSPMATTANGPWLGLATAGAAADTVMPATAAAASDAATQIRLVFMTTSRG